MLSQNSLTESAFSFKNSSVKWTDKIASTSKHVTCNSVRPKGIEEQELELKHLCIIKSTSPQEGSQKRQNIYTYSDQ